MKMQQIYATPETGERLAAITEAIRARSDTPLVDRDVETSYARTRVVEGGNPEGPPLVVLHGGGTNSVFALHFMPPGLERYRLIGVDIPGHPGGSDPVFVDPRGNDFGHWLVEVLDALSLDRVCVVGVSWGGFIVQRLAAVVPDRIEKALFIVSAGIVNPPAWPMIRYFLVPRILARVTGSPRYVRPFIDKLFPDDIDPLTREFFERYFMAVRAEMRPMKLCEPAEMARFTAPKCFIAAENDFFFPLDRVRERCADVFPEPREFHVLKGEKHVPSMAPETLATLSTVIDDFLQS